MSYSTIRISVVGCGHWGKNLVRDFTELGCLHSICDVAAERVHKIAAEYRTEIQTFQQVLQSNVDGVVIATPAAQHYNLAKQVITAGKHVFVEKPLSTEIDESQKLCDLAERAGKILMIGHILQYHQGFLELKKLTQKGGLGKLQYIYSNRLNFGKFRNEENSFWNFAPHDISMLLALTNEVPKTVYAIGSSHLVPDIQDITIAHMSFDHGIASHIFVSWLHPYKEQKFVVVGEDGMAVFDDNLGWEEKLKLYPHQICWKDGVPYPETAQCRWIPVRASEPLKSECRHFLDCIVQNTSPRTDGKEGMRVMRVLDAAQRSLATSKVVCLT